YGDDVLVEVAEATSSGLPTIWELVGSVNTTVLVGVIVQARCRVSMCSFALVRLLRQKIGTYDQAGGVVFVYDSFKMRNRTHE
ncbi:MAG: hypothetical protein WBW03_18315, partial [Silvibacterium sp.]